MFPQKLREEVLEVAKKLGYKTIGQRYKDRKTKKYKVGIAQMFELDEQKKYLLYYDEEYFRRGLFRKKYRSNLFI